MSPGPFILWLVIELGRLYLTPAASERVVTAILGQTAKLPCVHVGWSQSSNSMCWGRGPCSKSKCNDQLVDTDGVKALSRKSSRYSLRENIQRGDVSLTISNIQESDSGVYCCRIEVPGWFSDMKQNIRLKVIRGKAEKRRGDRRWLTCIGGKKMNTEQSLLRIGPEGNVELE